MEKKQRYRALKGINFMRDGEDVRVEEGETTSGIPAASAKWMLKEGVIEEVGRAEDPS